MTDGFAGRLLKVDLSTNRIREEKLDLSLAKTLMGSVGIAAKIMLDDVGVEIEPFDQDNRLILATGVLTGSTTPGGNKSVLMARSPLTSLGGYSLVSGRFGIELKQAGYDAIIVRGKSETPMYLWAFDNGAELKDATEIWGMDTFQTCEAIKERQGVRDLRTASIGPAGENLVRIASIETDDGRAAGRCGLGAIMGSKKLKAIAVRGTGKIGIANEMKFQELCKESTKRILEKKPLPFGTAGSVVAFEEMGNLPVKNWTAGRFPAAAKISGQTMTQTILTGKKTCFACPVACGRYVEIKEDPYGPLKNYGPEYEAVGTLGSLCMNDDLESIAKANDLCNRLGIDVISTGATIAFGMECYDKGIITRDDTDGIELIWGNHNAVVRMCELIGKKDGFGVTLGGGAKSAADKIGKGSQLFALHVKGLELPAHSPYRFKEMGLAYAVSNRGACHNRGTPSFVSRGVLSQEIGLSTKTDGFATEGKARTTKLHQDACSVIDALGVCKFLVFFGGMDLSILADLYSAATGWETSLEDLMTMGERIWFMQRIFNIRMGATREDDTLPKRFMDEPLPDGPAKGQLVDLSQMLNEYYELRGLDDDGRPKEERLHDLGLDFAIEYVR